MAVIKMNMKQFADHKKKLAERFLPAAKRGVVSAAQRAVALVQQKTREAPPANPGGIGHGGAVNEGRFLRGWKSEKTDDGARIFNDVPHAPIVEHGRRPGAKQPPTKVIVVWLRRRLGLSEEQAEAIAFPVARAIGKRGLVGRKILENAHDEIAALAHEEILHELDAEIRRAT